MKIRFIEKSMVKSFHMEMKAFLILGGILCFLYSCSIVNNMNEKGRTETPQVYKATANGKFLGNIWSGSSEPLNFSKYWNQVTPENAGKWGSVETSEGVYNWSTLDAQYNYSKSHGFPFKFHTLVWGSQQPSWISSLSATNQVLAVIRWISNVGARYPNLDYIDVVNEPIKTGLPSYGAAIGGSGSTGWDWVIFAFTQARKYCKGKLLLNEYSVENDTSAASTYATIINLLKARGLIDGVGIQGHYFSLDNVATGTLSNCLSIISAPGLPLYISELDLDGDDATQLARYQKYFPILWNYPSIQGITLWGYVQGSMWTTEAYLMTTSGTERPALTWLMQYVGITSSSSSSRSSAVSSAVSSSRSSVVSSAVSSSRSSAVSSAVSSSRSSAVSSVTSSAASSVSGGYAVNYNVSNDWGTGATVTVTMKNNSASALSSWTLVWTFAGTQKITQIWNATQTTSGATVTAKNLSYNGTIGANGGTQSFGFNLSYTGTNAKPTAFTLNGTACSLY